MSNSDIAIKVEDISKSFKLPHEQSNGIKQLLVNIFNHKRGYETQQVLENINLEIKKGEFFGIVGRNGSGKSTLLKLLAGIYVPDTGAVTVNGSLTPFIELGVGFNPELTGRENIFLNGALLGFSKSEMEAMYSEIVAFAELEKFMDQKLKNYSSGMQVRLAFSIAIRANTDILVLDEVLAVGDEAFQRKCNDYFSEIKDSGKTVILVTHSMEAVRKFCSRAALIRNGKLVVVGTPNDVANQYTEDSFENAQKSHHPNERPLGLTDRVPAFNITPVSKTILTADDELRFRINYTITDNVPVNIKFSILDVGRGGYTLAQNGAMAIAKKGDTSLEYIFPLSLYNDGEFMISAVLDEEATDRRIAFTAEENSFKFAIRNPHNDGNALLRREGKYYGRWEDGRPDFQKLR